jgi:CHASE2 domain-containing sensor protein
VRNLLMHEAVKSLPQIAVIGICAVLALAITWAVMRIAPYMVALAAIVLLGGWGYLAGVMLAREFWVLPLAQPVLAVIVSFAAAWVYRQLRRI